MCLNNSVAIRLHHLSPGVFSLGILSGTGNTNVPAFTLPNSTFERVCIHTEIKEENTVHAHAHTRTLTHFTEAV